MHFLKNVKIIITKQMQFGIPFVLRPLHKVQFDETNSHYKHFISHL